MGSTEARVDYMGSSILMGVFSNADLQLQDEWKVNLCTVDASLSEKRCVMMSAEAHHATQHLWFLKYSALPEMLRCFIFCYEEEVFFFSKGSFTPVTLWSCVVVRFMSPG